MSFEIVDRFEKEVANFFGSPYAVATDCCTHAIELCLRYKDIKQTTVPKHTYLSIPMTLEKLGLKWQFVKEEWQDYYELGNTNIIDAAVLWKENSFISGKLMCISFQFQKHLSLGRGGMILCDNASDRDELVKMSYDGRHRNAPWAEQQITRIGYHYYMTPETAALGLNKITEAKNTESKSWDWNNYPDVSTMPFFKKIR